MVYSYIHHINDSAALAFTHVSKALYNLQHDTAIDKLELKELPQECEQAWSWQQSAPR